MTTPLCTAPVPTQPSPFTTNKIKEKAGSGKIQFSKSGTIGTRTFIVPFYDESTNKWFSDFVNTLVGGNPTGVILPDGTEQVDDPDIFGSGYPFLFCQEVDVEGNGTPIGVDNDDPPRAIYSEAVITAKYCVRRELKIKVNVKSISVPGTDYIFTGELASDPFPDDGSELPDGTDEEKAAKAAAKKAYEERRLREKVGMILSNGEIEVRAKCVFNPDFDTYNDLQNKTNEFEIDVRDYMGNVVFTLQPETVVFIGYEKEQIPLPSGRSSWEITFHFLYNPNNVNKLYNPRGLKGLNGDPDLPPGYYYVRTEKEPHDPVFLLDSLESVININSPVAP